MNERFWRSSDKEREKGYLLEDGIYHCLLCNYTTEEGYIYPVDERFADAAKQMELHIEEAHGSVFNHLIELGKKMNGLSEHQSAILKLFHDGVSDYGIQQTLGIGSVSTVRNHRHALKEKERQAKSFMTLMSILSKADGDRKETVAPHKTATMIDDRYDITVEEVEKVITKYFPDGTDKPLTSFYVKEKHKIIILREIIKKFADRRRYSEKQVDSILKDIYPDDHALIRRYLIQYGFMDRERDGSAYWVKEESVKKGKKSCNPMASRGTTEKTDRRINVYGTEQLDNRKDF